MNAMTKETLSVDAVNAIEEQTRKEIEFSPEFAPNYTTLRLINTLRQCEERLAAEVERLKYTNQTKEKQMTITTVTSITGLKITDNEQKIMGTVEPIDWPTDKDERLGFIRGFVKKYADENLPQKEIFEYLHTIVNLNLPALPEPMQDGQRDPEKFYQNNPPLQAWSGPAGG